MPEDSKETPSRKLAWSIVGSIVAIVVGATYVWLTGIFDPPAVAVSVEQSFLEAKAGSATYDSDGKSVVHIAEVSIKNTWSKSLKSVEVRGMIVPTDQSDEELPWTAFDPKCQGVDPTRTFVGFYDVIMRCDFLHPNETVILTIGFRVNKIGALEIKVRSPEGEQTFDHAFERDVHD
ncbi:MAG TPA: hypothetical protein VHA33_02780 [Candidatus Angelobacter sp.]|jgi:hypothetical protein|nr:hypothetical protein [Candidatus Angelobacter sp.]